MHTKMLLTFGGIILFALIMQMILFWNSSSKMIYQQTENESYNSLKNMQNDIYTYVKKSRIVSWAYATKKIICMT